MKLTLTYRLDSPATAIAAHFAARAGDDPWAGGVVAPGRFAPVITQGREAIAGPRPASAPRRMVPRLWGVPPPTSVGDGGRLVTSVRNLESPFWIGNLRNSEFRCLVPATELALWGGTDPTTGKRRRLRLTCADQPLFALAGVWKDSEVPGFALLTCEPGAALRKAGVERGPVVLPADPAAWQAWLNAGWDRAAALVAPYPSSLTALS